MSISLALVPVALALRVVMGKQRFESWIDSLQVKIPTTFNDEADLLVTVRKAGYDADHWGGSIKTHVRGEEFFFFWDKIDGVWTAVFAKADSKTDIKHFIRDLETKSGRRVFQWEGESRKVTVLPSKTFPTNFRDPDLLMQTLAEHNLNPTRSSDGRIVCTTADCRLSFRQEENQPFSVSIHGAPDVRQMFEHLGNINDSYCHNVQAKTYQNLMSRVQQRGLVVDQEEVLEDNSIVITLNIQG